MHTLKLPGGSKNHFLGNWAFPIFKGLKLKRLVWTNMAQIQNLAAEVPSDLIRIASANLLSTHHPISIWLRHPWIQHPFILLPLPSSLRLCHMSEKFSLSSSPCKLSCVIHVLHMTSVSSKKILDWADPRKGWRTDFHITNPSSHGCRFHGNLHTFVVD